MKAAPLLLLCAAVLVAGAAGRELQQVTGTNCGGVKNCNTCSYVRLTGLTTTTLCSKCDSGYAPNANQTRCWCAPGYYTADSTGTAPTTCSACGTGKYCPGSDKNALSYAAAQVTCGTNKNTLTTTARAETECVADAGYGWVNGAGVAAVQCMKGYYNSGYNRKACTQCPGGLTTAGATEVGATKVADCVAPKGYYYLNGRAVLCAKGTTKATDGNAQCTKCSPGLTTDNPNATVPLDQGTATDCKYIAAGWNAEGVRCPVGKYGAERTSGACTSCPTGFTTKLEGSVDVNSCLLLPGYEWKGVSGGIPVTATKCVEGTYNPGYNRETCTSCGTCSGGSSCAAGLIPTRAIDGTVITGANSSASCAVPAGYGTNRTSVSSVVAYECPANTYGRSNYTWGLVDTECTKCPENSHTSGTGSTSATQCLTDVGYGWYDGSVKKCAYAYYNGGNNQETCAYCGDGFNTTAEGSDAAADCLVDYGYTNATSGVVRPCLQGFYKDTLGDGACLECPLGTTTVITEAATNITDCNACRPGFGTYAQSSATRAGTSCQICDNGFYNFGYNLGNAAASGCLRCNNTGDATLTQSRPGSSSPDECYPDFVAGVTGGSSLSYDLITMDASALSDASTGGGNASATACQAKCTGGCIYWVYDDGTTSGGPASCKVRSAGGSDAAALAYDIATGATSETLIIYFEINEDTYVAYKGHSTDYLSTGDAITGGTYTSLNLAREGCRTNAACIGIVFDNAATPKYKTFAGRVTTGFDNRVKVIGNAINGFIAQPTNAPLTR